MISILLTCLKVIGVVLLSIIALFLIVLLICLFATFFYRISAEYDHQLLLKGRLTWLFGLFKIEFDYDKQFQKTIFIAGFKWNPSRKAVKPKKKSVFHKGQELKEEHESTAQVQNKAELEATAQPVQNKDKLEATTQPVQNNDKLDATTQPVQNKVKLDATTQPVQNKTDQGFKRKAESGDTNNRSKKCQRKSRCVHKKLKDRLLQRIHLIIEKVKKFVCNIKNVLQNISEYYELLMQENTKKALRKVFYRLKRLLKALLPRKMHADVFFGMEDPASMGMILAVYGAMYPVLGSKISLYPDYENTMFKMQAKAKGRFCLASLLYQILRVWFDKNVQAIIQKLKKEKEDGRE